MIVKQIAHEYKLSFIALLETKVASNKMQIIAKKMTRDWDWISNSQHTNRGRIWILWDGDVLSVQCISSSEQYMTCSVSSKDDKLSYIATIVYALNDQIGRKNLWHDLSVFKQNVNCPWIIGGDFNAIICNEEKLGGSQVPESETEDFQKFIELNQLHHLKATECFFTWCNKQDANSRIWSRLDRVLVNEEWILKYTPSQVDFLVPNFSDHSPALVIIHDDEICEGKKPFKFFSMWIKHPDFYAKVKSVWEQNFRGYYMYKLVMKLKNLKPVLKELNKRHFMNISEQFIRAKGELTKIQQHLANDPFNSDLIIKEKKMSKCLYRGG
ncbi:uncharacterized protein LOC109826664 [Asparagus officinalis]|uniref:uncharacterized protein LOC109826664 n=1 Tax=Asparagus officinalis TaxID=4686 RepID=UPI00098E4CAE|nr:uncharacterized protein LOC109826664 [Asparagus officinalis]